ncbi:hypothetical protein MAR_036284 [Mya arenaria]|uniref:Uncharacterized protein n=1 Tax=Mya arenaria TaxID=6604 RepID=A0ABY7EMK2_MYAAR|nr:uncharacterized protein LOC128240409 [Mya arenaria]XP_052813008.1 uncharacterized protein LOC128240409 [Mya arenaria]WAR11208.1 hypothetical protein MAR_036284 [Mya arenaria]
MDDGSPVNIRSLHCFVFPAFDIGQCCNSYASYAFGKQYARRPLKRSKSEDIIIPRVKIRKDLLENQRNIEERIAHLENLEKTASARNDVYVESEASQFLSYSYLQKRANDILTWCQKEMNANNDNELCPDKILVAAKRPHSAVLQKFKALEQVEDFKSNIAVFIGSDDDLFVDFSCEHLQSAIICRIQPTDRTSSDERDIKRETWGYLCQASNLTNDNITAHIDNVLERVVLEKLARAAKALPKQRKSTEGIITEVKKLFTVTKVQMPNWLKEWEPDSESVAARNKLEQISAKVLSFPEVFACDVSNECITVMIRRENASQIGDLRKKLNVFGLLNEEFNIHVAEIKQLADDKFRSGDRIQVRGSKKGGTLGCFAKLKKETDDQPKTVVITARHVVNVNDTDSKELEVNQETLGKVMENKEEADERVLDIEIGEVTAPQSKCDTYFRRENGDKGFAELYEPSPSELVNQRVHLWGARTSPGAAKLSNFKLSASDAGEYMFIAMSNDKNVLAKEGDSGAMVLMERYPKDSPNMYAIGTLVGEVHHYPIDDRPTETGKEKVPESEQPSSSLLEGPEVKARPMQAIANEKLYAVVPIKKGFDQLSKKHRGSLTLFTSSDQQ